MGVFKRDSHAALFLGPRFVLVVEVDGSDRLIAVLEVIPLVQGGWIIPYGYEQTCF